MKLEKPNPMSAAQIGRFLMDIILNDDLQNEIDRISGLVMNENRLERQKQDIDAVNSTSDPAELVNLLRKTEDMNAKQKNTFKRGADNAACN